MSTTEKRYLTCAETAKLVRKALRQEFPGVKFSVRSHEYSMGASIYVRWTDGPTSEQVNAVTQSFAGADFDGMIDMKSYREHWLEPDGTVKVAHIRGTEGSMGSIPEMITDPPSPNARLVKMGADYVQTTRELTEATKAKIVAHIERKYALGTPDNKLDMEARLDTMQCWGSDFFYRVSGSASVNEFGIAYAK